MAKLNTEEIRGIGRDIILKHPEGIATADLVNTILEEHPETPRGTIQTQVSKIPAYFPGLVTKPNRGLFAPISATDQPEPGTTVEKKSEITPSGTRVQESDFYGPFAKFLRTDLDEVTNAVVLGGSALRSKWGTPDVIGVYKPRDTDLFKFPMEIVSAELKIDPLQPVVAFGQAVAYRLFSAKTYIGMPSTLTGEDQGRLEALCMLFGVGLVLFDLDPQTPHFTIRMRAQRFSPDMFYVNEFADRLRVSDRSAFDELFR